MKLVLVEGVPASLVRRAVDDWVKEENRCDIKVYEVDGVCSDLDPDDPKVHARVTTSPHYIDGWWRFASGTTLTEVPSYPGSGWEANPVAEALNNLRDSGLPLYDIGEVVEVVSTEGNGISEKDPDLGRAGPVIGYPHVDPTSGMPEGSVEVWFEDHRRHFGPDQVESTGEQRDLERVDLPEVPLFTPAEEK